VRATAFLTAMVARYAAAPALLGFGLLNEPAVRDVLRYCLGSWNPWMAKHALKNHTVHLTVADVSCAPAC